MLSDRIGKDIIKENHGLRLSEENIGIVIVITHGTDRPWGGPVGIYDINDDKNMLNLLCVGACNMYKDDEDVVIYVLYRADDKLFAIEYIGEPIFENPDCCGAVVGC